MSQMGMAWIALPHVFPAHPQEAFLGIRNLSQTGNLRLAPIPPDPMGSGLRVQQSFQLHI
jgi:hypothetical protein